MPKINSLIYRIFFASLVLLPLLLTFSAYMLERAYKNSLLNAEKDALLAQMYGLLAVAEPSETELSLPSTLFEPRFNTSDSGLYALVVENVGEQTVGKTASSKNPTTTDRLKAPDIQRWESSSLAISPFTFATQALRDSRESPSIDVVNATRLDHSNTPPDQDKNESISAYFYLKFNTIWEIAGEDRLYSFVVFHSQDDMKNELVSYRTELARWLGGLALLLIAVQIIIIRWGLLPLGRLAKDISRLESGEIGSLASNYPDEIIPVTQSVNQLLEAEKKHRTRYKNTLADLAHSLKTPLSVIRSIINSESLNQEKNNASGTLQIDEQIDRMSSIIHHQLNRATASSAKTYQTPIPLAPLFKRLAGAMAKVYQDKNMSFTINMDDTIGYPCEEGDMLEVFGNIMENAYKYGHHRVQIHGQDKGDYIAISIEDDGQGIEAALRNSILKRGMRADTATPGQGIGLSVAVDILSSYDAGLSIETSSMGGAAFIVSLTK